MRELILIKDILYHTQFNFLLTKKIILIKYRICSLVVSNFQINTILIIPNMG